MGLGLKKLFRSYPVIVICLVVFGTTIFLRHTGKLVWMELRVHDVLLASQTPDLRAADQIVVLGIDDVDIATLGHYPIYDVELADVLETLEQMGAASIGIDIYRDMPVPDPKGLQKRFEEVLIRFKNIVAVAWFIPDPPGVSNVLHSVGTRNGATLWDMRAIAPPAVLKERHRRVGLANLPTDLDFVVRRGILYLDRFRSDVVDKFDPILRADTAKAELHFCTLSTAVANLFLESIKVLNAADPDRAHLVNFWPKIFNNRPIEANDGPYIAADAGGFQYLLDFAGPRPSEIRTIQLRQVLRAMNYEEATHYETDDDRLNALKPEDIRGKVVLIGVTATSVRDTVNMPVQYNVPAVFLHALMVDQLLRQVQFKVPPIRVVSKYIEGLLAGVFCVLAALLAPRLFSIPRFILVAMGGMAVVFLSAYAALRLRYFLPVVPPAMSWLITLGLVNVVTLSRERARFREAKKIFTPIVGEAVLDLLLRNARDLMEKGGLRPRKVVATIMFTDLKDFTPYTESMEANLLMEWLRDYMNVMTGILADPKREGAILHFAGDGLMAVFGAPPFRNSDDEFKKDAINAVECALDMRRALANNRPGWAVAGKPAPEMRIGIYTGRIIVGSLGSAKRLEYATIGDPVNTASRLESHDKCLVGPDIAPDGCRILIGDDTYKYVKDRFETRSIGTIAVKGKQKKIEAYAVIGRKQ